MSSRGAEAENGHVTTTEYETTSITALGIKILKGRGRNHSLPDYAHTPGSVYAKMKPNGKDLHEMRFYDEKGHPIIEIANHPEPSINNGNRHENVVHFHIYKGLDRDNVQRMDAHPEVKSKYAKYLKEFDLYDKC